MKESKEELKSLLMSVKEETEKAGLKLNKIYGESNMETYITVCKIDSQWEFAVYLMLLLFFLDILFPACASSSPVFLMMYSAYKLDKQGDNI